MIRIAKYKWAVESAIGSLKRWKFLANVVSNTRIIFIGDNDQIVGSLINAFRPFLLLQIPRVTLNYSEII